MSDKNIDKRLLGTWISDAKTTLERWRWPKGVSAAKKKKLASIFGKLRVKYTRSYINTDMDGHKTKAKYRLIASDASSVVLECTETIEPTKMTPELKLFLGMEAENNLVHIFFDKDGYWVPIRNSCAQEWFRRVE